MNHPAYGQQWNTVAAFFRVLVLLLRKAVQVEVGHVQESKLQDAFGVGVGVLLSVCQTSNTNVLQLFRNM